MLSRPPPTLPLTKFLDKPGDVAQDPQGLAGGRAAGLELMIAEES